MCVWRAVIAEILSAVGRDSDVERAGQIPRKEDSSSRRPAANLQSNYDNDECQLKRTIRHRCHLQPNWLVNCDCLHSIPLYAFQLNHNFWKHFVQPVIVRAWTGEDLSYSRSGQLETDVTECRGTWTSWRIVATEHMTSHHDDDDDVSFVVIFDFTWLKYLRRRLQILSTMSCWMLSWFLMSVFWCERFLTRQRFSGDIPSRMLIACL